MQNKATAAQARPGAEPDVAFGFMGGKALGRGVRARAGEATAGKPAGYSGTPCRDVGYDHAMDLLDERIAGGWRRFASRREAVSWMRLRRHLDQMPGAGFVDLACDRMNEAALIFTYRGHRFGVDLQEGGFHFAVEDPACPDEVLHDVLGYADRLLAPGKV